MAGGLAGQHDIEQAGHAGAVEGGVGGSARTLRHQAVVVLEELHFLGILERDVDHRIARGRSGAPRQADHGVVVAADAHRVAEHEAGLFVGDGLVMAAQQRPAGDHLGGFAQGTGFDAGKHDAHVLALHLYLHGQVGDVRRLGHAGQAGQAAVDVVAD